MFYKRIGNTVDDGPTVSTNGVGIKVGQLENITGSSSLTWMPLEHIAYGSAFINCGLSLMSQARWHGSLSQSMGSYRNSTHIVRYIILKITKY